MKGTEAKDFKEYKVKNIDGIHLEIDAGHIVVEVAADNFEVIKKFAWGLDTSFAIVGVRDKNGGLHINVFETKDVHKLPVSA